MPNRFKTRRGPNIPSTAELLDYELGLNTSTTQLYTKIGGVIKALNAQSAQNLNNVPYEFYARTDIPEKFHHDVTIIGKLYATAEKAKYADIAEYYETDTTYGPGDILMVGTDTECTIADGSMPLMGACSTDPAYLMNGQIEDLMDEDDNPLIKHFAPVALKGRIPVKITGEAKRGQYIILDPENPGIAKAVNKIPAKLDRDCNFIGICITASEKKSGICEVKV